MTAAIVLSSSVLTVLLVAVLVREIRRRRAIQVLADPVTHVALTCGIALRPSIPCPRRKAGCWPRWTGSWPSG